MHTCMYTGSKAVKESGLYTKVIAKAGLAISDLKETGQKCLKNLSKYWNS